MGMHRFFAGLWCGTALFFLGRALTIAAQDGEIGMRAIGLAVMGCLALGQAAKNWSQR